jgi:hypothetical protein
MKLIKLNEEDYIIVDDSEIKEGDFMYDIDGDLGIAIGKDKFEWEGNRKITHSVKPLEEVCCTPNNQIKRYIDCKGCDKKQLGFNKIKPLSLSEVEEAIYGYNVEKMAESKWNELTANLKLDTLNKGMWCGGFQHGFNTHKELVKARFLSTQLYSNENHLEWIYNRLIEVHGENSNYDYMIEFKKIIQSLQPTEWDVQFVNGKLTLKQ